ncbi:hypothetical protein, partial [Listeria monocytogenes]
GRYVTFFYSRYYFREFVSGGFKIISKRNFFLQAVYFML